MGVPHAGGGLREERMEVLHPRCAGLDVHKRCYGASGEDEASSSPYTTDGDAPCRSRMT